VPRACLVSESGSDILSRDEVEEEEESDARQRRSPVVSERESAGSRGVSVQAGKGVHQMELSRLFLGNFARSRMSRTVATPFAYEMEMLSPRAWNRRQ